MKQLSVSFSKINIFMGMEKKEEEEPEEKGGKEGEEEDDDSDESDDEEEEDKENEEKDDEEDDEEGEEEVGPDWWKERISEVGKRGEEARDMVHKLQKQLEEALEREKKLLDTLEEIKGERNEKGQEEEWSWEEVCKRLRELREVEESNLEEIKKMNGMLKKIGKAASVSLPVSTPLNSSSPFNRLLGVPSGGYPSSPFYSPSISPSISPSPSPSPSPPPPTPRRGNLSSSNRSSSSISLTTNPLSSSSPRLAPVPFSFSHMFVGREGRGKGDEVCEALKFGKGFMAMGFSNGVVEGRRRGKGEEAKEEGEIAQYHSKRKVLSIVEAKDYVVVLLGESVAEWEDDGEKEGGSVVVLQLVNSEWVEICKRPSPHTQEAVCISFPFSSPSPPPSNATGGEVKAAGGEPKIFNKLSLRSSTGVVSKGKGRKKPKISVSPHCSPSRSRPVSPLAPSSSSSSSYSSYPSTSNPCNCLSGSSSPGPAFRACSCSSPSLFSSSSSSPSSLIWVGDRTGLGLLWGLTEGGDRLNPSLSLLRKVELGMPVLSACYFNGRGGTMVACGSVGGQVSLLSVDELKGEGGEGQGEWTSWRVVRGSHGRQDIRSLLFVGGNGGEQMVWSGGADGSVCVWKVTDPLEKKAFSLPCSPLPAPLASTPPLLALPTSTVSNATNINTSSEFDSMTNIEQTDPTDSPTPTISSNPNCSNPSISNPSSTPVLANSVADPSLQSSISNPCSGSTNPLSGSSPLSASFFPAPTPPIESLSPPAIPLSPPPSALPISPASAHFSPPPGLPLSPNLGLSSPVLPPSKTSLLTGSHTATHFSFETKWEEGSGAWALLSTARYHEDCIVGIEHFSLKNVVVTASRDGVVCVWDIHGIVCLHKVPPPPLSSYMPRPFVTSFSKSCNAGEELGLWCGFSNGLVGIWGGEGVGTPKAEKGAPRSVTAPIQAGQPFKKEPKGEGALTVIEGDKETPRTVSFIAPIPTETAPSPPSSPPTTPKQNKRKNRPLSSFGILNPHSTSSKMKGKYPKMKKEDKEREKEEKKEREKEEKKEREKEEKKEKEREKEEKKEKKVQRRRSESLRGTATHFEVNQAAKAVEPGKGGEGGATDNSLFKMKKRGSGKTKSMMKGQVGTGMGTGSGEVFSFKWGEVFSEPQVYFLLHFYHLICLFLFV